MKEIFELKLLRFIVDLRELITYRKYKWLINMSSCLGFSGEYIQLKVRWHFFYLLETGRLRCNSF